MKKPYKIFDLIKYGLTKQKLKNRNEQPMATEGR